MNRKQVIRLTECQLHKIIKEAVKKIYESWEDLGGDMFIDNDTGEVMTKQEQMNSDWEDLPKTTKVDFPILRSEGNGSTYSEDEFSKDYINNYCNPKRVASPSASYVWGKDFSEYYPTPEDYWDYKNTRAYKYTKDKDTLEKNAKANKKKEQTKYQHALDSADKHPLHRKGSANRALMDMNN